MAVLPVLTDPESMDVIMEAEANVVQGMAQFLCSTFVPSLQEIVVTPAEPTVNQVTEQVAAIKTLLCGYVAKECAMADLVKAIAKKTAVDNGVDPTVVCACSCNGEE
jgi:hypothetical protein